MRSGVAVSLVMAAMLAGCDRTERAEPPSPPGLEETAIARGLVADPASLTITGVYARENDRLCVAGEADRARIGVFLGYGEGHRCVASGSVARDGRVLRIALSPDCRFDAEFDGARVEFPGRVPDGCRSLCTGRASLAGFAADRLSDAEGEALALRAPDGEPLCAAP